MKYLFLNDFLPFFNCPIEKEKYQHTDIQDRHYLPLNHKNENNKTNLAQFLAALAPQDFMQNETHLKGIVRLHEQFALSLKINLLNLPTKTLFS